MNARTTVIVVLALAIGRHPAHADRREASLHAELVGGALTTGDVDAGDATATVPMAGLAVRASYATQDSFQYDGALTVLRSAEAEFPAHTFMRPGQPAITGPYRVAALVSRLDAGVTLRFGVRWIPTVRVATGLQLRRLGDVAVDGPIGAVDGRAARLELALVGTAALGLDHRLDRRLIVGVAAGASLALPTDGAATRSLELTVHAAYYWYPRW